MEMNEIQISRNIKSCREKVGKSQSNMASALHISKQTYLKIENNPLQYSIKKLNDISKVIGCNIDEFFLKSNFTQSESEEDG